MLNSKVDVSTDTFMTKRNQVQYSFKEQAAIKDQYIFESPYQHDFLGLGGNSDQFFRQISYPVKLDDLYRVKQTSITVDNYNHAPVIVEIIDDELKQHLNAKFLLQCWLKGGTKQYERKLQYDILAWKSQHGEFICKLDSREEQTKYIYYQHFEGENSMLKIVDIFEDSCKNPFSYKILKPHFRFAFSYIEYLPTTDKIVTVQIKTSFKMLSFDLSYQHLESSCEILCIFENEENLMVGTQLFFKDNIVRFEEQHEIIPRVNHYYDPIIKFKYVHALGNYLFAVALRKSLLVDIYWNNSLVATSSEQFQDIDVTFEFIQLYSLAGRLKVFPLSIGSKMKFESIQDKGPISQHDWDRIFYSKLADYFKFYTSYCLINTSFFIARENIISIYDIIKKKWIKHFYEDENVVQVFKTEKSDGEYQLGIFLNTGKVKLIDTLDSTEPMLWDIQQTDHLMSGTTIQIMNDNQNYRFFLKLAKDDITGKPVLFCFSRSKVQNLTEFVEDLRLDTIIIPLYYQYYWNVFILFNKQTGHLRYYYSSLYIDGQGYNAYQVILLKLHHINDSLNLIGKNLFSMTTDIETELVIIDEKDINLIDFSSNQQKIIENVHIKGFQLIENDIIYALVKNPEKVDETGFHLFDLKLILEQKQAQSFFLDKSLVGVNNILDFSHDNQRFSYMEHFDLITIIPTLHSNIINYMGMLKRDKYLAAKKINDRFIALDIRNRLTTWDAVTGKLINVHQREEDFTDFEIFKSTINDTTFKMGHQYSQVLLISKNSLENIRDEDYYEDYQINSKLENCTTLFKRMSKTYREFKLIEIISPEEVKVHFTYIHPYYGINVYYRICFSEDLNFMFIRLINQKNFIYQRESKVQSDYITWKLYSRIYQFDFQISDLVFTNYITSPDLKYFLDYDNINKKYLIRDTKSSTKIYEIPKTLINVNEKNYKSLVKGFKWIDSETIRFIDQEGIEAIIELNNNFKIRSSCKLPLNQLIDQTQHFYISKTQNIQKGETLKRLQINYQTFFQLYNHDKVRDDIEFYNCLIKTEYSLNLCSDPYVIDLSFTYMHLKMAEQIKNTKETIMDNIFYLTQMPSLCYNIFPRGNTLLHYAVGKLDIIEKIYQISEREKDPFEIPFIRNFEKQTPLHLSIQSGQSQESDYYLMKLSQASIGHSSRAIVNILPLAIESDLQNVNLYFNARFMTTQRLDQVKRGSLMLDDEVEFVKCQQPIFSQEDDIKRKILNRGKNQVDIQLQLYDIPKLHCYDNKNSEDFFEALSSSKIELFANKGIQLIIDFKWPLIQKFTIQFLFLPYILYLGLYFGYSNFIFVDRFHDQETEKENWYISDKAFFAIGPLLILFSLYFLIHEIYQLQRTGKRYLTSIWNYNDLIPTILIPLLVLQDFFHVKYNFVHTFHAFTSLFMWFKLLYFLRMFKATGYLVRMLIEVIYDMKIFFLVLLIVFFALTDSFLSLSNGQEDLELRYAGDNFFYAFVYAFRTGLGDFSVDNYNASIQFMTSWIIFFLCVILILIVMLNLLISIISQSFDRINSSAVEASYQERARIISENLYLIPKSVQIKYAHKRQYIVIAKEVQNEEIKMLDEGLKPFMEMFKLIKLAIEESKKK
ncbi:wd-40 repeat protein [Stylonychia lemnae]|uniref:Wd-40 repeat protein n=1 Tax=Stylonychia lemnae TaxID=5949 RepID=A0A078ARR9_STYLE|nr:wd-40 repeat protein [Stylonychia lemnae]|eukprot:CDW83568.1 wd-40 repeat protein [Stylonychia lemnae]